MSDLNKQRIILELTKLELTLDIYLINQEVAWVNSKRVLGLIGNLRSDYKSA